MIAGRSIQHQVITNTADDFEATLHFQHGIQRETLGDMTRAIGHYQESLRIRTGFALAHRNLGRLLAKRGDWSDALPHFENYARISPQDAAGQHALAICHQQLGNNEIARTQFEKTIRIDPGHVQSLDALGSIHLLAGDAAEAVRYFQSVLELAPDRSFARNNLAWILATCPNPEIRDGEKALLLATQLVENEGGEKPAFLDTLSAAQAECGHFKEAIATARRGAQLARNAEQAALASQMEQRITLYQRGEAYRDSSARSGDE